MATIMELFREEVFQEKIRVSLVAVLMKKHHEPSDTYADKSTGTVSHVDLPQGVEAIDGGKAVERDNYVGIKADCELVVWYKLASGEGENSEDCSLTATGYASLAFSFDVSPTDNAADLAESVRVSVQAGDITLS
jgi:hypothetical protein